VRIRLYLDEDTMDADLVDALRARGVDLETADEAGMLRREDRDILAYTAEQRRVVYTFNTGHFCAIHADFLQGGRDHAGIVVAQQQRHSVGEQMRRLLNLIGAMPAEEMENRLEFLSDWG
jgi:hypothetical protein